MATIVNNPPADTNSSGGMGFLLGIIALIIFAVLFFMYGLPMVSNLGGTQVNVPDKIDVNVQQAK